MHRQFPAQPEIQRDVRWRTAFHSRPRVCSLEARSGGTMRRVQIEYELKELGGVALRTDLTRVTGLGRRAMDSALARLVHAGSITRPRRGLYALPGVDPALVAAASARGVVSCVSAAAMWRLPLLDRPAHPHVSVSGQTSGTARRMLTRGTVVHWDSGLSPRRRFDRPEPAAALAQVIQCLPLAEAVAVLDAALGRGLVTRRDLARSRPQTGWGEHERAVRLADPQAGSITESIARVALLGAGLQVALQVQLRGVGYVDMVINGRLVVEIDGFAYHSSPEQFREDRRRDRVLLLEHGLPRLRFTYNDVVYDTEAFVIAVQRGVAQAS